MAKIVPDKRYALELSEKEYNTILVLLGRITYDTFLKELKEFQSTDRNKIKVLDHDGQNELYESFRTNR